MSEHTASLDDDRKAIYKLHKDWWEANSGLDIPRMAACFPKGAQNYLMFNLNGHPYFGIDEKIELWKWYQGQIEIPEIGDIRIMRTTISGDMGWIASEGVFPLRPIAVTLAAELNCPVWACDISLAALAVAERNRARHQARVAFFAGDLVEAVAPASIDLLISNPPYVPGADAANMQTEVRDWEPHVALFAGDTGLEIYRRLVAGARVVLKPGGRLLMELGYQSLEGVRGLLADGWADFEVISDLAGWPRVIGCSA